MIEKECKTLVGVYKVQTFGTLQTMVVLAKAYQVRQLIKIIEKYKLQVD